jgi:hypothetical protein
MTPAVPVDSIWDLERSLPVLLFIIFYHKVVDTFEVLQATPANSHSGNKKAIIMIEAMKLRPRAKLGLPVRHHLPHTIHHGNNTWTVQKPKRILKRATGPGDMKQQWKTENMLDIHAALICVGLPVGWPVLRQSVVMGSNWTNIERWVCGYEGYGDIGGLYSNKTEEMEMLNWIS